MIAPAIPVGLAFFSALAFAALAGGSIGVMALASIYAIAVALPVSYVICLPIGYAVHRVFRRLGWTHLWAYLLAGAFLSAPFVLFVIPGGRRDFLYWLTIFNLAVDGPLAALAFWSIVRPYDSITTG